MNHLPLSRNRQDNDYFFVISPNVQEEERSWRESTARSVQSFRDEVSRTDWDFVKDAKIRFLNIEIERWDKLGDTIASTLKNDDPVALLLMREVISVIDGLKKRVRALVGRTATPQKLNIERAKERRIQEFVEIPNLQRNISCPFHQDKTPSFHAYDDGRRFKCFSCGESGDIIDFIQKLHACDFKEAVKILTH